MSLIKVYIASSLDGFIAPKDGSVDWLGTCCEQIPNEDYGYADFFANIGAVVLGRKTYEQILGFGVPWPYKGRNCFVFSHDKNFEPSTPQTQVLTEFSSENLAKIKDCTQQDIWLIGGGELISTFCQHRAIHEFTLSLMPTILGGGVPLMPDLQNPQNLNLEKMETFSNGVVSIVYTPVFFEAEL